MRRFEARAGVASTRDEGIAELLLGNTSEDSLLLVLIQPFLLLLDQLDKLVAVDPVFLHNLRRVHPVVESIVLSFAVLIAYGIIIIIVVIVVFLCAILFLLFRVGVVLVIDTKHIGHTLKHVLKNT